MRVLALAGLLSYCLGFVLFAQTATSVDRVSKDDVAKAIGMNELRHPYLYFTDKDKPQLLQRIQTDPESRAILRGLLVEGNRLVKMPFSRRKLSEPTHPRFETDSEASAYVGLICDGALKLSFLYQMTGDTTYAKRAIEFALAISDLPEWIMGAHTFDIIYPRVWPWNVPDDQVVFSYDLGSARVARVLSTAYDWLYPVLSIPERDKIRNGLLEKAITRVRGNYDFHWWSTAYRCNWSLICYSGLGISALALLKEHPQLVDVVAECYNRINLTFDQIGDEGGWQEGRGYHAYMMSSGTYFMEPLKRLSRGKFNLFRHGKVFKHPFDFELYALSAAFGDGEPEPVGPTSTVNKLVDETQGSTSAWYRETFLKEGTDLFDIIWPRSTVRPVEPAQKSMLFKNIDWAVLRTDFLDPSAFTIACKAGFNDDPHHGHLDCGQFILTWHGVPFIRDLGRMRYDEYYFNEDRYRYVLASSEGHNVISVNGEQQIPAKTKDRPWLENVGGRILEFRSDDRRDYVLMDPTHAYPGKQLKKWRRHVVLEKPAVTLILDEVGTEAGADIRARFFPGVGGGDREELRGQGRTRGSARREGSALPRAEQGSFQVLKNHVMLSDGKNHMIALVPLVLGSEAAIVQDAVSAMVVAEDARLVEHPYVEARTTAKAAASILVTLLLPVKDQRDADAVARSATVTSPQPDQVVVSVIRADGPLRWRFDRTKDGYLLNSAR
jgi:hypothetical protein